jgi:hypothetical protein
MSQIKMAYRYKKILRKRIITFLLSAMETIIFLTSGKQKIFRLEKVNITKEYVHFLTKQIKCPKRCHVAVKQ